MSLETKVMEQLKQAMKDKNETALLTLRAIKAAILVEKTASGAKDTLAEADELKLIQKMVKQRKDSLEIFKSQGREDLANKEQAELDILNEFLPKQMSVEEVESAVTAAIASIGATGPADMGKVMGIVSKQLAGKAEGKTISDIVKQQLANL